MKKLPLKFKLTELALLIFELNLFAAGLVMIYAALWGSSSVLYIPAQVLIAMMPAAMSVGFAFWLVYRLRCLRQAENRRWALAGATCLGIVALSFGAAVGKLNMVHMSEPFQLAVSSAIHNPLLKHAGLSSLLAFMSIGFVFSLTFIFKAAKEPFAAKDTTEQLNAQLGQLSERIVQGWSDSLVAKVDGFLNDGQIDKAVDFYLKETGCSKDEASIIIADWPEQRLVLQVEQLNRSLTDEAGQAGEQNRRGTVSTGAAASSGTA
jgi:hypothetical protein